MSETTIEADADLQILDAVYGLAKVTEKVISLSIAIPHLNHCA
jgi:hypothetical protein